MMNECRTNEMFKRMIKKFTLINLIYQNLAKTILYLHQEKQNCLVIFNQHVLNTLLSVNKSMLISITCNYVFDAISKYCLRLDDNGLNVNYDSCQHFQDKNHKSWSSALTIIVQIFPDGFRHVPCVM